MGEDENRGRVNVHKLRTGPLVLAPFRYGRGEGTELEGEEQWIARYFCHPALAKEVDAG